MSDTAKILCKVGDNKPKGVKSKIKDGTKVDIIQDVNGVRKVIGTAQVSITVTPSPPLDQPLVVDAGDDIIVKEGQVVKLDGSAIDPDNIIIEAHWSQAQGQQVELVEDKANFDATFTAPKLLGDSPEVYLFNLQAENDKSDVMTDQIQVTVTKDGTSPLPPPGAKNTYDSNVDGKWGNGHARSFDSFDPDLPKPYKNGKGIMMAASGNPFGEIDGNGTFTISANPGHGRGYIDSINFNSATEYDLRFNDDNVDTHTQQNQSLHQNGGVCEHRYGGNNHMIDRKKKKVGLKIEKCHNIHDDGPEENMTGDIAVGKWVRVKNIDAVNVAKKEIHLETWIDFQDGKGFVKQVEWTRTNCPDYYIAEAVFMTLSYMWWRINNTKKSEGISIKNVKNYPL